MTFDWFTVHIFFLRFFIIVIYESTLKEKIVIVYALIITLKN